MKNREEMSLKEALEETYGILAGIVLPPMPAVQHVEFTQKIALPIAQAMENLKNLVEDTGEAEKAPDPETEEKAIREEDL